ncbi:TIGR03086 family metal-binding protein [Streptosporangium sp. CA-135522]|uniref:TIGR03086 family metal-binding protein n=1 Tax=Streptosporangium sp. CA-135522 TaxID=3240072 RepID=UPI003D8BDFA5
MDIRDLDRRAVRASVEVVARATADDLRRPTPCADWTLADLLAHMTVQHRGFAAAARGAGDDLAVWRVQPLGDDAVSVYAEAAEHVLAAFAEDGVLERAFTLPELAQSGSDRSPAFPAAQAIAFHFIDYLVHAWDVAQALGVEFTADPELVEVAWPIAQMVPDGEQRRLPGAAFQPSLAAPEGGTRFDQVLALLGRSTARTTSLPSG